jgi:hypothetical protein
MTIADLPTADSSNGGHRISPPRQQPVQLQPPKTR